MIGVFDSGLGGISVWQELVKLMPNQEYIYVADSKNCPYGNKDADFIIKRASIISKFLVDKGVDVVVVACNTATAASINHLRDTFSVPFVGIEPALKPAALISKTKVVGVLATKNTLKGDKYNFTLEKFATDVKVINTVGEGLVEFVENADFDSPELIRLINKYINPMLESNADMIVLGCTHYPFLTDTIKKLIGSNVKLINPAPAVASQTKKIIKGRNLSESSKTTFYSNGDLNKLKGFIREISQSGNFIYNELII